MARKNVHKASKLGGCTEINTEVISFIKQTMRTLLSCNGKLKTCLNTDQTHFEIFFFCNEKTLIKAFYKKFLIKTFASTPKQNSQKQLGTDTESLICLLKPAAHFKMLLNTNFRPIISTFQNQK